MTLIHNIKREDETKMIDLTLEKCNIDTYILYSLSALFCPKGEVALETDFVNIFVDINNRFFKKIRTNNYKIIFSFNRKIKDPRCF